MATLTIYNWQLADVKDSLAFPTAIYMWNNIRHTKNNGKSSAFYCYFIQNNSDLGHIPGNISLINSINNKTTTWWQIITKASTSIILDADAEFGNNITGTHDFVQLRLT